MVKFSDTKERDFLRVGAAADILGVSVFRLREAVAAGLVRARRDNEGNLRIDLSGINPERVGKEIEHQAARVAGPDLIDLLFDEIEELRTSLSASDAQVAALSDLATRQAAAIDQSRAMLDDMAAREDRMKALLDRAMTNLEGDAAGQERLSRVSEAALTLLDQTGDRLEVSLGQSVEFERLLTRALDLSEAAKAVDENQTEVLSSATDQALTLLDGAMDQAEDGRAMTSQTNQTLERAMAAGVRLEQELVGRDETIKRQQGAMDRALGISERAVAMVSDVPQPRPRSFWGWLTGR